MIGNTQEAVEFLTKFYAGARWVLTAVLPDGKTDTRTFHEPAEASKWISELQGKKNMYFHVNPTRSDMSSKASKEDIYAMSWLHVDIDPRAGEDVEEEKVRALKLLRAFPQKPTAIVDSGGGIQGFWKLQHSDDLIFDGNRDKAQTLELYNVQLEKTFQADHCHNIDRIMRIPGTINLPTATKRKKGRTPYLAKLVEWNDTQFPISNFIPAVRVQSAKPGLTSGQPAVKIVASALDIGVDELRDWAKEHNKNISDHTLALIASGQDPINPTKYESRSEALFKVCCDLVRAGVPNEMIFAVITGNNEIAVSVRDKPNWERYANRQIERANEEAIDPHLRQMNEKHAVIADIGGKCRVISEVYDDSLERHRISKQSFEDIRNRYRHIKVVVGQGKGGAPIEKLLGNFWLDHPQRRQYEKIVFAPGKEIEGSYNLWQGFAVEPIPGQRHESFLQHTLEHVCCGDQTNYEYILNWLARLVQYPDKTGQVAVVLRGERGTGKSFWAKTIGRLFGRHFMQVSDSKHLVGSFNAHLRDTVLLFGDEAFFAGDKKHESVLKTLVTEEVLVLEGKGIDAEAASNYVHLILASNEEWVIPAGLDERRFFVLEISSNGRGRFDYFQSIKNELDKGGFSSLLHMLLTRDISQFEVRDYPRTAALQQQKILSMSAEMQWFYNKLQHGQVLKEDQVWRKVVIKEQLYADYIAEMQEQSKHYRQGRTGFFSFVASIMPEGYPISRQQHMVLKVRNDNGHIIDLKKRVYVFEIPELEVIRAHWDAKLGGPFKWQPVLSTQSDIDTEDRVEF